MIRPSTYRDKDYKTLQCYRGAQRSLEDTYNICRTEYPSLRFKTFIKYFKKLIKEENVKGRYCNCSRNIVFSNKFEYEPDKKYYFLHPIGNLANHYLENMGKYGFRNESFNLENLNKILNDNS